MSKKKTKASTLTPSNEVPMALGFLTKASILDKLVVTQRNDRYNSADFERIPFYKPTSQVISFAAKDYNITRSINEEDGEGN